VEKIAEELGRSESTIRNHLQGKTEAGKLVRETYETIKEKGGILELPVAISVAQQEELNKVKEQLAQYEEKIRKLEEKIKSARERLSQLLQELSS